MYNLMNDLGKQEDTIKVYHFLDTCIEVVVAKLRYLITLLLYRVSALAFSAYY